MGICRVVHWHACLLASALAEQILSTVDLTDRQVTEKLAAFEKDQDPTLVHEALDLIEAAERDMPVGDAAARKDALSRRLLFFAALDRNVDPQWDSRKVPVKGAPPPLTHGIVYPSGEVDPSTIPDPAERAEYERALRASKDYEKWYDVQFQLRQLDQRALLFVEWLLAERYTRSLADRQEFDELLASSSLSEARKKQIRALASIRS